MQSYISHESPTTNYIEYYRNLSLTASFSTSYEFCSIVVANLREFINAVSFCFTRLTLLHDFRSTLNRLFTQFKTRLVRYYTSLFRVQHCKHTHNSAARREFVKRVELFISSRAYILQFRTANNLWKL